MRPAINISNDAANRNLAQAMVMPLTINTAQIYPGEALVTVAGQQSKAMADQIMAADKARLTWLVDSLSKPDLVAAEDAIRVH